MATTTSIINEFLVRWDESGKLQGVHVAYMTTYTADDGSARRWMEDPRPVALTDSDTLASIAASINTGSIASINDLNAQVAQLEADKQAALGTAEGLQTRLDAANARIASYEEDLKAAKTVLPQGPSI